MTRRISPFAIAATLVLLALPAQAQTYAPPAPKTPSQILGAHIQKPPAGPVSRPAGKGGINIGQASQPGSSNLTPQECRKLGGTTSVDDGGSCKLRMRCTIIHANGDVNSICIDEAG